MRSNLQIILPGNFAQKHEQLILKYLTQGRASLTLVEWQQLFVGFDALHLAQVVTEAEPLTFQQIYVIHVERPFADSYIHQLLQLTDVQQQHAALRAQIARQIVDRLQQMGLRQAEVRASNFLLAYASTSENLLLWVMPLTWRFTATCPKVGLPFKPMKFVILMHDCPITI